MIYNYWNKIVDVTCTPSHITFFITFYKAIKWDVQIYISDLNWKCCALNEKHNLGHTLIKQQSIAKSVMELIYSTKLKIRKKIIEK